MLIESELRELFHTESAIGRDDFYRMASGRVRQGEAESHRKSHSLGKWSNTQQSGGTVQKQ